MSRFLATVIERAFGEPPGLEPRRPSRFEPAEPLPPAPASGLLQDAADPVGARAGTLSSPARPAAEIFPRPGRRAGDDPPTSPPVRPSADRRSGRVNAATRQEPAEGRVADGREPASPEVPARPRPPRRPDPPLAEPRAGTREGEEPAPVAVAAHTAQALPARAVAATGPAEIDPQDAMSPAGAVTSPAGPAVASPAGPPPATADQARGRKAAGETGTLAVLDLARVREGLAAAETGTEPTGAGPVIRVSIGRLEVRAPAPPARPVAESILRSGGRLSLAEYLRQRREGER